MTGTVSAKKFQDVLTQKRHNLKYMRINNAQENTKYLTESCKEYKTTLELTAPYTSKKNSIVKKKFEVL